MKDNFDLARNVFELGVKINKVNSIEAYDTREQELKDKYADYPVYMSSYDEGEEE